MKRKWDQINNDQRTKKSNKKASEIPSQSTETGNNQENEEFVLTKELADGEILTDIAGSHWRIGKPVGKGSFGEIFLAADEINKPVENDKSYYVAKIEPHSNGPLFVEIHCLLNVKNTKKNNDEEPTLGIPEYIASGSHYFKNNRYRFLVMPRYKYDLHSIMKTGQLSRKHLLIIAMKTIDILMHLHKTNYVHSDIKAENLMIGRYKNSSISKSILNLAEQTEEKLLSKAQDEERGNKRKNKIKNHSTPYSGSNPVRSCRMASKEKVKKTFYEEMLKSHYLRQVPAIDYSAFLNGDSNESSEKFIEKSSSFRSNSSDSSDNESDFEYSLKINKKKNKQKIDKKAQDKKRFDKRKIKKRKVTRKQHPNATEEESDDESEEDHIYLIDYGLASKYINADGEHRPFCMDQRRAHDGTLEFTSRDAHFGAHSRRSDLECFGFNLIYWSQGYLPWKDEKMQQKPPELIHRLKEIFMADVKEMMKLFYGKEFPKFLAEYMQYVGGLAYDEEPNYDYLKKLFQQEFIRLGYQNSEMKLKLSEIKSSCTRKHEMSEMDLMTSNITDLKTVKKLGFLDGQENGENGGVAVMSQINQTFNLHSSSKLSPKYLRSKAVNGNKGHPKRQPKKHKAEMDEMKRRTGRKLSVIDLVSIDPDKIARERAEKEFERFDDKTNEQSLQRYKGRPTYAILEIENRIKSKQLNTNQNSSETTIDKEVIKGYTKPMMDVLRKRQLYIEEQIKQDLMNEDGSTFITPTRRNRDGLRNILKQTKRSIIYHNNIKKLQKKISKKTKKVTTQRPDESECKKKQKIEIAVPKKRGRKRKIILPDEEEKKETNCKITNEPSENSNITNESKAISVKSVVTTRRRPRKSASPKKFSYNKNQAKNRTVARSTSSPKYTLVEDNDNAVSSFEEVCEDAEKPSLLQSDSEHKLPGSDDEDVHDNDDEEDFEMELESEEEEEDDEEEEGAEYEIESDQESNAEERDDDEFENESKNAYESNESADEFTDILDDDEEEEETDVEETDESDDDSIDIKYSPIKTRHARKRITFNTTINQKLRGRRKLFNLSGYNDNRNFRTVSTRG